MITKQGVEIRKKRMLLQKLHDSSYFRASSLQTFIKGSYCQLSKKFDALICEHIKRAQNGFRDLTLAEQLKELSAIKPEIERILQMDNLDNLHTEVLTELAEETFYKIREFYNHLLKY